MDLHFHNEPSSAAGSVYSCRPESEFYKTMSRRTSSVADTFQELESVGEVVTRFELDMACVCEKLANLNLLLMHMETIESYFEAYVSDMNPNISDLEVKALEFDFLSGFLNSEVIVLETHITDFQSDQTNMQEFISSSKYLGETSEEQEDMLHDSEKSLQQSMDQLLELKTRAAMFEKNVSRLAGAETSTDKDDSADKSNNDLPELKDKMNLQTVEHQRHILRMLEKALEREIELEKRVSESTQIEEALTIRLHESEQEVISAEEETAIILEKLYDADHTSEVLTGVCKELLSKITMSQSQLDVKNPAIEHKETAEKLEAKYLKEQIVEAERRAENAEAKCKMLNETSKELKGSSEKVVLLEKKLRDTKIKLKLSKSRKNSFEDMDSMVVMMVGVGVGVGVADDYYAIPRFH